MKKLLTAGLIALSASAASANPVMTDVDNLLEQGLRNSVNTLYSNIASFANDASITAPQALIDAINGSVTRTTMTFTTVDSLSSLSTAADAPDITFATTDTNFYQDNYDLTSINSARDLYNTDMFASTVLDGNGNVNLNYNVYFPTQSDNVDPERTLPVSAGHLGSIYNAIGKQLDIVNYIAYNASPSTFADAVVDINRHLTNAEHLRTNLNSLMHDHQDVSNKASALRGMLELNQ